MHSAFKRKVKKELKIKEKNKKQNISITISQNTNNYYNYSNTLQTLNFFSCEYNIYICINSTT